MSSLKHLITPIPELTPHLRRTIRQRHYGVNLTSRSLEAFKILEWASPEQHLATRDLPSDGMNRVDNDPWLWESAKRTSSVASRARGLLNE